MTVQGGRVEGHPDDRAGWQGVQADQGDAHPQGLQGHNFDDCASMPN